MASEQEQKIEIDNPYMPSEDIQVFENEIEFYLNQFIEENNIEDMRTETQNLWNACLLYIGRYVFKPNKDKLKAKPYKTDNNIKYNNISNYNAYDLDKINYICNIYIDLCYRYDKEISINGFSKLVNIDYTTINQWGTQQTNNSPSSVSSFTIYQKLHQEQEESLSNFLTTGKRNPMGIMAKLNTFYDWRTTKTETIRTEKQTLSVEDRQKELQGLLSQPQDIVLDIPNTDTETSKT